MGNMGKQIAKRIMLVRCCAALGLAVALAWLPARAQQEAPKQAATQAEEPPTGKAFASPEDAAAALYAAARRNDEAELRVILGPNAKQILEWTDDPEERRAEREFYAQKYDQMHRLVKEPDETVAIYVGAENWPLPIPLVEYKGQWYFDAELGRMEIMYRRIGRNEMEALEVCRALVEAEKDYYAAAHQYTDRFVSDDGTHNGLYWKTAVGAEKSPIGPYLAHAGVGGSNEGNRVPYHGYYYRVLKFSSPAGTATGSFAILAFPAQYRLSGVRSFLVDQNGEAYEKDFGERTNSLAKENPPFPPDNTWKKVE